ncbi:MAG TPA: DUF445 family protein [Gemmatimonadales bacterium]|nr:DUF445 family protein [Gemmatimonadales bacterium]
MDSQTLLAGLLTVAVGAISGGVTNAVAIWMLFHPYEQRGRWPFRLHGAIPKNKERLAKSIGKTVGEKLLTPADLSERLSAPEIRAAFDGALSGFLDEILERERGPLVDLLPVSVAGELDAWIGRTGERVSVELADYLASPAFTAQAEEWIAQWRAEYGDRPVGDVLTADRRGDLEGRLDEWLAQFTEGSDLEGALRHFVEVQLERLGRDSHPLIDRLPAGLLGTVEASISDYLPVAIERIGAVLSDPEAKGKIHQALRTAFDRAVRDMLLHERLLAKLVVTDKTFTRLLDALERDGFERFAESLTTPEMRAQLTRAVNDGLVSFLRIPLQDRLAAMGPEKQAALAGTLGDWLVAVARDDATRTVARRAVGRLLDATERRTWNDLLGGLPAARVARFVAESAGGAEGRRWVAEATRSSIRALLRRPLGRPSAWLGPEATARVRTSILNAAWGWTERQVPKVVAEFNVQQMVEQKVLGFSTQRMEEIIRNVTQRELTLIVRLGYLLGAMVGLLAFGINELVR